MSGTAGTVTIASDGPRRFEAYLAQSPAERASQKHPAILVLSDMFGLNEPIRAVADHYAASGHTALVPNLFWRSEIPGVIPYDDAQHPAAWARLKALDLGVVTADMTTAVHWLRAQPCCNGKVAAVGFCFGGGIVNTMAVRIPDLAAAVPFYGVQPSAADTAKIKAPLLIHYAGLDERIDAGWPAWKEALDSNHVKYQEYTYPNVNHGFHNDTTPRYDEAAAKLAWSRTLAFFAQHLAR